VTRLVAAEPANNSVVDLAPAEIQRHRAKGATQEAAQLVSSNAEFAEEAARIVTSQGSRPAARDEARKLLLGSDHGRSRSGAERSVGKQTL
jgi:hypothetical protein